MARAVVTGGAGFLGSHLCDRLVAEGCDVVAVDNLVTGNEENIAHLRCGAGFEFSRQDITEGIHLPGPIDYVFHLASPASPVDFSVRPLEIMRVNSIGTHHALELARGAGARFMLASTSEVYGDPLVHPQNEDYCGNVNPVGPRAVYDEGKRYAEAATMAYVRLYGLDAHIARIFNTYGERMRLDDGRVVPNFVGQALRGEPITVYGDGSQTRSFCYCSDLIDGFWRLTNSPHTGPVNLGNPAERTMREFAEEIKRLTGSTSPIVQVAMPMADDPKQRRPDIGRAKQLLGWEPRVGLEEGMARTIAHFRGKLAVPA